MQPQIYTTDQVRSGHLLMAPPWPHQRDLLASWLMKTLEMKKPKPFWKTALAAALAALAKKVAKLRVKMSRKSNLAIRLYILSGLVQEFALSLAQVVSSAAHPKWSDAASRSCITRRCFMSLLFVDRTFRHFLSGKNGDSRTQAEINKQRIGGFMQVKCHWQYQYVCTYLYIHLKFIKTDRQTNRQTNK